MAKNLVILFFLFPATLFAQIVITGKVSSMVSQKAIADASIFLNSTSVGSKSLDDGTFTLNNVKNGQYDLVVSCVGYETYHQSIFVSGANINLQDIKLIPTITQLKEVKVRYNPKREGYIKLFIADFIGKSENAAQCKLINPELLDLVYDETTGKLTASADDFLIIENRALGYRIKYLLKSFAKEPQNGYLMYSGESVFEPMTGSKSDEKRWLKNRSKIYHGSDMHFLRSCITYRVNEEGFTVRRLIRKPNPDRPADSVIKAKIRLFRNALGLNDSLRYWSEKSRLDKIIQMLVKTPLNIADYAAATQKKGVYAFGFKDCLQITYKNNYTTIITFTEPFSYFDSNGIIHNPNSNIMEGYWGSLRVADLLPDDYEVTEK